MDSLNFLNYADSGEKESQTQQWINFGMRLGVSSALHPFEYAKVLIQLGHEPLAPHPGRTFFGRNVLVLPNIFKYGTAFIPSTSMQAIDGNHTNVKQSVTFAKRMDWPAALSVWVPSWPAHWWRHLAVSASRNNWATVRSWTRARARR